MDEQTDNPIKVIVFGATGRAGGSLVVAGLKLGLQVSAFVRDAAKLERLFGGTLPSELTVFQGDALDADAVARAVAGHGAVVNAAADNYDRRRFEAICETVVSVADKQLEYPRRFWQFGGLPGLNVPHTKIMGTDLPGMPAIFRSHKVNFGQLVRSSLDWSFICPGPMYFAGSVSPSENTIVTTDFMPYEIAEWTKWLPRIAHPFIMRSHLKEMTVTFEDVAFLIMKNLASAGPYSKKRIAAVTRP